MRIWNCLMWTLHAHFSNGLHDGLCYRCWQYTKTVINLYPKNFSQKCTDLNYNVSIQNRLVPPYRLCFSLCISYMHRGGNILNIEIIRANRLVKMWWNSWPFDYDGQIEVCLYCFNCANCLCLDSMCMFENLRITLPFCPAYDWNFNAFTLLIQFKITGFEIMIS